MTNLCPYCKHIYLDGEEHSKVCKSMPPYSDSYPEDRCYECGLMIDDNPDVEFFEEEVGTEWVTDKLQYLKGTVLICEVCYETQNHFRS